MPDSWAWRSHNWKIDGIGLCSRRTAPSRLTRRWGGNAGAIVEYEVFPNWAIRAGGGITRFGYEATNKALQYTEDLQFYDLNMSVRKSFWF